MVDKTNMRLVNAMLDATRNSRQKEYGHPLINFLRMAEDANAYWRGRLAEGEFWTPLDVIFTNTGWKRAREIQMHKDDNLIDSMGYTDCYERIDDWMHELGFERGAEWFRTCTEQEMIDLRYQIERQLRAAERETRDERKGTDETISRFDGELVSVYSKR